MKIIQLTNIEGKKCYVNMSNALYWEPYYFPGSVNTFVTLVVFEQCNLVVLEDVQAVLSRIQKNN